MKFAIVGLILGALISTFVVSEKNAADYRAEQAGKQEPVVLGHRIDSQGQFVLVTR